MTAVLIIIDAVLTLANAVLIVDICRKQRVIDKIIEKQLGTPISGAKTRIISPYLRGGGANESD